MAQSASIKVEQRTRLGTAECRRLRREGMIPGNVYGHEQEPVAVKAVLEDIDSLIHSGTHVLDIELDGTTQKTMFKDVQWDAFGTRIQHFDLLRVDANERVSIEVPFEIRGLSPGVLAGGVFDQPNHTLQMEVPVFAIPDSIEVRVHDLQIGDAIHVSDLELPEGSTVDLPPEAVVIQVVEPQEISEEDEEGEGAGGAEPEVIGRKADAEDDEG